MKERRKEERYNIDELVIAIPNRNDAQIARVVNISKGGLAIRYVDLEWLGKAETIDILIDKEVLLPHIPIESVADFELGEEGLFSTIKERQCCIKFGELSSEQRLVIDRLIEVYKKHNN